MELEYPLKRVFCHCPEWCSSWGQGGGGGGCRTSLEGSGMEIPTQSLYLVPRRVKRVRCLQHAAAGATCLRHVNPSGYSWMGPGLADLDGQRLSELQSRCSPVWGASRGIWDLSSQPVCWAGQKDSGQEEVALQRGVQPPSLLGLRSLFSTTAHLLLVFQLSK